MIKEFPVISWFDKSTVRHLRLHYSFFLMPVYFFALSQAGVIHWPKAIAGFIILHLLIFPSTNGYNSYQDRDETSIGGLKYPPKINENLFYVTLLMEIVAVLAGLFISIAFSVMVLIFITMSKLYSYRGIRLKKYPVIAFLVVFVFQGGFVFLMASESIFTMPFFERFTATTFMCMLISSLFIGSMYPLTQIYQHDADRKDGVISLSYLLGYKGTFVFSGIFFAAGIMIWVAYSAMKSQFLPLVLFLLFLLPVIVQISKWFSMVRKDPSYVNYEHTMGAIQLSSLCMNAYFIMLTIANQPATI